MCLTSDTKVILQFKRSKNCIFSLILLLYFFSLAYSLFCAIKRIYSIFYILYRIYHRHEGLIKVSRVAFPYFVNNTVSVHPNGIFPLSGKWYSWNTCKICRNWQGIEKLGPSAACEWCTSSTISRIIVIAPRNGIHLRERKSWFCFSILFVRWWCWRWLLWGRKLL